MNNKETIEQVERGYRMANPVHIVYPESKTCPKELAQAQSFFSLGDMTLSRNV